MRALSTVLLCLLLGTAPCLHAEAPTVTEGKVKSGPATLHYWTQGEGSPVLLLSGGPGFLNYLQPVMAELSKGHRCILVDQRGTGKSTVEPMDESTINVKVLVEDLEVLRRHLKIERWTVFGHSWGGMLAMAYGPAHPASVQALVLVDSGGMTLEFTSYFGDNIEARLLPSDKEALAYWEDPARKKADPERASSESLRTLVAGYFFDRKGALPLIQAMGPGFLSRSMSRLMWKDLGAHFDLREGMKAFDRPTLILMGRQDPIGESTQYAIRDACKTSRLLFIEQCGHFPWLEQPGEFYKAVNGFLDGIK